MPPPQSRTSSQDEHVASIPDLLGVLRRRFWVVLLACVLIAIIVTIIDLLRTPTYEASIKILVGQEGSKNVPSSLGSDVQGLQQLARTMAEAVPTRPVADAVIGRLGLRTTTDEFLENLSAQQVGSTQFIEVSYQDEDPKQARQVADAVGEVFSNQVSEVSPSANAITATVWERAAVPATPASPNLPRDVTLALVLGCALGVGFAFLLEQLDDRWRSPEEAERISGVPTFGVIPEFKAARRKRGAS